MASFFKIIHNGCFAVIVKRKKVKIPNHLSKRAIAIHKTLRNNGFPQCDEAVAFAGSSRIEVAALFILELKQIMTSPAISKSPEKQKSDSKSPAHSTTNTEPPPSNADGPSTSSAPPSDPFSWCRIFKLADLMMKQGC
ncbi:hypothetical protein KGM_207397 [Danaus plexippus plexippus]|uniref:Uncharacterized protein n=1 Tax=Danaus plexippus plexippus TaxID=278856 RepID=A0A212FH27_DANPL|nr:hypothetical protein KGM_207397 [Danaus plexippus plexippus]